MLRARQKFGKYKIHKRLATGGFAEVYRAYDTIEGVNVALKIPHEAMLAEKRLADILREVRLTAQLDHPNILAIKNADYIEGRFVIVYPLGEETLADKLANRLSFRTILDYTEQMLTAVAYAHRKRVLHCDIKPENFIVFPGNMLKLGDFGIAKIATRTLSASGSGTVGYLAPEQALGRPSLRSDVFSLGLIIFQMLTGMLPEWPFHWPPPRFERLKRKAHRDFIAVIRRAMSVDARKRYADAVGMLAAFERVKRKAHKPTKTRRRTRRTSQDGPGQWRLVQFKEFKRNFGKILETHFECTRCQGPISERMATCPWCGHRPKTFKGETRYPARCRECKRGMKLDWRFCPQEYGPAQGPRTNRSFSDKRYTANCANPSCRKPLIPFMKYCPWCRAKIRRKWKIAGSAHKCPRCGWGILKSYWTHCAWCGRQLHQ
jgi:serine/threonine-protein kinase